MGFCWGVIFQGKVIGVLDTGWGVTHLDGERLPCSKKFIDRLVLRMEWQLRPLNGVEYKITGNPFPARGSYFGGYDYENCLEVIEDCLGGDIGCLY